MWKIESEWNLGEQIAENAITNTCEGHNWQCPGRFQGGTVRLRLELFVKSVPELKDFYTRVLCFDEVSYQPEGYSVFRKGDIQIALQAQSQLPDGHPLKPQAMNEQVWELKLFSNMTILMLYIRMS